MTPYCPSLAMLASSCYRIPVWHHGIALVLYCVPSFSSNFSPHQCICRGLSPYVAPVVSMTLDGANSSLNFAMPRPTKPVYQSVSKFIYFWISISLQNLPLCLWPLFMYGIGIRLKP